MIQRDRQFQYEPVTEPLGPPPPSSASWAPTYPDQIHNPARVAFATLIPFFVPSPQPEEIIQLDWQPEFPAEVRGAEPLVAEGAFAIPDSTALFDPSTEPVPVFYPDRIDEPPQLPTALQTAYFGTPIGPTVIAGMRGFSDQVKDTLGSGDDRLWEVVGNAENISFDQTNAFPDGDGWCMKHDNPASTSTDVSAPLDATQTNIVLHGRIKVEDYTAGGGNFDLAYVKVQTGGTVYSIRYNFAGDKIQFVIGGNIIDTITPVDGEWFHFNWKINVGSTTHRQEVIVNGTSYGSGTLTTTPKVLDSVILGEVFTNRAARVAYYDDFCWSYDDTNWPLGDLSVKQLPVNRDGAHNLQGVITDDGGGTTDLYQSVDELPADNADYIRQTAVDATAYAELAYEPMPDSGGAPLAVQALWGSDPLNGSTNSSEIRAVDGSNSQTLFSGAQSNNHQKSGVIVTRPGNRPWTTAEVDALRLRVGYASNTTNLPRWTWTQLQYVRERFEEQALRWQPEYPDFARGPRPRVPEFPDWAGPIEPPPPAPDLSWQPEYPDFSRAPKPLVAEGQFAFDPASPGGFPGASPIPTAAVVQAWRQQFQYLPLAGPLFAEAAAVPELSWGSAYPDQAPGRAPLVSEGFSVEPEQPEHAEQLDWQPEYPDFARAPQPATWTGYTFPEQPEGTWLDWQPEYPDFARLAERAPEFPAWTGPEETLEGVLELTWQPAYPDFARAPQPLVPEGWLSESRQPEETIPADWQPEYPDFARAPQPLVPEGLWSGPIEPPAAPIPDLAWSPEYPDFARLAERAPEFPAWTGPEETLEGLVELEWQPTYPDFARAPQPLVPEGWIAESRQPEHSAPLDWQPEWPDFARTAERAPEFPAWTGPEETLEGELPLQWEPQYPDFARAPEPLTWQGFALPEQPEHSAPLDWQPTYADFAREAQRAAEFPAWTGPEETLEGLAELEWQPEYPDFARPPQPLVPTGLWSGPVEPPVVPAPELSWQPEYPDFARQAKQSPEFPAWVAPEEPILAAPARSPDAPNLTVQAWRQQVQYLPLTGPLFTGPAAPAPELSWEPEFPDQAPGRQPLVPEGISVEPEQPEHAEQLDWQPEYPDFARAPQPLVPEGWVAESRQPEHAAPLDWQPEYPDFAREAQRAAEFPFWTGPEETLEEAKPLDWQPEYPDFAREAQRVVDFPTGEWPAQPPPPAPELSWAPTYPDFARQAQRVVEFPAWTGPEETLLEAPDLSWAPEYPDFARAPQPLVAEGYSVVPEQPEETLQLDWQPTYADFARAPEPATWTGYAFPEQPEGTFLDWQPEYADFARQAQRAVEFPFWTGPEETLEEAKPLDWQPTYPDFARQAQPAAEFPAWTSSLEPEASAEDLGWQPEFPSFVRVPRPLVPEGLWAGPEEPPSAEAPALSWAPSYPTFARTDLPLVPEGVFAGPETLVEPVVILYPAGQWWVRAPQFGEILQGPYTYPRGNAAAREASRRLVPGGDLTSELYLVGDDGVLRIKWRYVKGRKIAGPRVPRPGLP